MVCNEVASARDREASRRLRLSSVCQICAKPTERKSLFACSFIHPFLHVKKFTMPIDGFQTSYGRSYRAWKLLYP